MAPQPNIEQYAPVLGPRVAPAFLDFHQREADTLPLEDEVPEFLPTFIFPEHLRERYVLDLEQGTFRCRASLEDILKFSDITGDHNIVHTDPNPYTNRAIVQGNLIASLAEHLITGYFDRHHFEKVNTYFDEHHAWIPKPLRRLFSWFAIRNKYMSYLKYKFKDKFFADEELEFQIDADSFKFEKNTDENCQFTVRCDLVHVKNREMALAKGMRYSPSTITVKYDLVLPKSPSLQEVAPGEPLCTDEVTLSEEDYRVFQRMIGSSADNLPVMYPVVSTNSRILLKRQTELEAAGEKHFGTGIYSFYIVNLFRGARKVNIGDTLKSFYFPGSKDTDRMQDVILYVTNADEKVLYKFKAPILLLPVPDPTKVN
ncbi:hypothetical protein KY335_03675 [Candidatus Woesearchaeota archaeon]|nr:hypothetical protein [Candidatus Woesearchaeota archaeon]